MKTNDRRLTMPPPRSNREGGVKYVRRQQHAHASCVVRVSLACLCLAGLAGCRSLSLAFKAQEAGEPDAAANEPDARDRDLGAVPVAPEPDSSTAAEAGTQTGRQQPALTVADAIERVLRRHPEIIALRAVVQTALQERRLALDVRDPELNFTISDAETETRRTGQHELGGIMPNGTKYISGYLNDTIEAKTADSESWAIRLRVFPPNPFLMTARRMAAGAQYRIAESNLREAEQRIGREVKDLFNQLTAAEQDLEVSRRRLELRAEMRREIEKTALRGSRTELMLASGRYLRGLANRTERRRDRTIARARLCTLLGVQEAALNIVLLEQTPFAEALSRLDPHDLVLYALEHRPDLTRAHWQYRAARRRLAELRLTSAPWFTTLDATYAEQTSSEIRSPEWRTSAGTPYTELQPAFGTVDEDIESEWRISAGVTIPLFSPMTRWRRACATEAQSYQTQYFEAKERIPAEVRNSLAALRAILDELENYQAEADPYIRDIRKALPEMRALHMDPKDIASLSEELERYEAACAEAAFAYREELFAFETAIGTSLERYLALTPSGDGD